DELRRRLYRDGACDEDLRRYAEVRDSLLRLQQPRAEAARAPMAPEAPDAPSPPAARGHRALPVAAIAIASLLLAGTGAGIGAGIAATATRVQPHASATP